MVLKIGILIDGFFLKRWQKEIIDFIMNHPHLELKLLVLKNDQYKPIVGNSFFYRLITYLDRKIFSVKYNAFSVFDMNHLKDSVETVLINGKISRYSYRFHADDIGKIKLYELDVLIRFGFGIIKGNILSAAKYGIWSLHHGDNKVNRGGPPAFWEVVKQESVTGVTLQRLSDDLDGGNVIRKSFLSTNNTSFYRNQNATFWAGVELFTSALNDLSKGRLKLIDEADVEFFHRPDFPLFYSYPLYKNPSNRKSIKIFLSFWRRRIKETLIDKLNQPQWCLYFRYSNDGQPERSLFRYKKLKPPKGFDWADPFIIVHRQDFYLFFEELEIKKRRAHISYLRFSHSGQPQFTAPRKVLEEPFHLSYPFIFRENGAYYMIPEAGDSNEVWIYRCEKFPNKWVKYYKIFDKKALYDPTIFCFNGMWFLFGTEKINEGSSMDQYLHIYYTKNLFSNGWIAHPQNPITRDVRGARPAGKIFQWNDKWIRPAQIGAPKYGYGIQFNEIIKLTETEYQERIIDSILPEWTNDLLAAHTINFEYGFSVVDAQERNEVK